MGYFFPLVGSVQREEPSARASVCFGAVQQIVLCLKHHSLKGFAFDSCFEVYVIRIHANATPCAGVPSTNRHFAQNGRFQNSPPLKKGFSDKPCLFRSTFKNTVSRTPSEHKVTCLLQFGVAGSPR